MNAIYDDASQMIVLDGTTYHVADKTSYMYYKTRMSQSTRVYPNLITPKTNISGEGYSPDLDDSRNYFIPNYFSPNYYTT